MRSFFKFLQICAIIVPLSLLCSNSPFSTSTNLGNELIENYDPSITDFNLNITSIKKNFRIFGYSSYIDSLGDSQKGGLYNTGDSLFIGNWTDEYAAAYIEFDGNSLIEILKTIKDSMYTIQAFKLNLKFNASDPDSIMIGFYPEKSSADLLDISVIDSSYLVLDEVNQDGISQYSLDLGDYDSFKERFNSITTTPYDTVAVKDSITGSIIKGQILYDTAYEDVAFSLFCHLPLISLPSSRASENRPRILISYLKSPISVGDDSTIIDTVYAKYSDYTVLSSDPEHLDTMAVSSAATGREAVIAIDLASLWETMNDTARGYFYKNILHSEAVLHIDTVNTRNGSINFDYTFDRHYSNNPDKDPASWEAVSEEADTADNFYLSIELDNLNDFYNASSPPDTGYLYLYTNTDTFGKIRWGKSGEMPDSIEIYLVFSNSF